MGETGPAKALVLSEGRGKDGFGFFADTRGEEEELVLGVLCLSLGRLNVLCTKLLRTERTGKYKSWRAVYSSFLFFFFLFPLSIGWLCCSCFRCCCPCCFWLLFIDFMRGCGVV